jgi:DNA-binding transcriptional ArsR family regulator
VASWSFLTNHARGILFIAAHPDARIRDIADGLGVTERTAFALLTDLTEEGYIVKEKEGRRNRYHIQVEQPLGDPLSAERTIGELLDLLVEAQTWAHERSTYSGIERRRGRTA